ncbi:hypothetical protein N7463_009015 [Penicillium fimorum]|uniref:Uncharacterized protein n=1 Tax=Penicillium fimorum TaxID=1882269 RepID=A0A9W9XPY7_9EURO|nr:hypothetical protein N7463_009015 [Penicillium fimorum]
MRTPAPQLVRQQWESGSSMSCIGGRWRWWRLAQEQELHSPEQQLQVQGDMMNIDVVGKEP